MLIDKHYSEDYGVVLEPIHDMGHPAIRVIITEYGYDHLGMIAAPNRNTTIEQRVVFHMATRINDLENEVVKLRALSSEKERYIMELTKKLHELERRIENDQENA